MEAEVSEDEPIPSRLDKNWCRVFVVPQVAVHVRRTNLLADTIVAELILVKHIILKRSDSAGIANRVMVHPNIMNQKIHPATCAQNLLTTKVS